MHVSVQKKLEEYKALLIKWQKKINLVGSSTLDDIEKRHFADSAQLYPFIPSQARVLVDLGSGAGFPGMILALLDQTSKEKKEKIEVHLIESDLRKAAFLQEVARVCNIQVTIHRKRIEQIKDLKADIITARALAPLESLLDYSFPFLKEDSVCLFLKGEKSMKEIEEAQKKYCMNIKEFPSSLYENGVILKISEIKNESAKA